MAALMVDEVGHVRIFRMSRPERRNAIDQNLAQELSAAFDDAESNRQVRAIVLTGDGGYFSAGTDLASESPPATEAGGPYGFLTRVRTTPLIAAVEGFALGGGFECALACDLVVASRGTRLGLPEVKRGVIANSGALFRAGSSLPRSIAMELIVTGDPILAERAHEFGLVNVLCEPGESLGVALELAERVAVNSPDAVALSMRAVSRHRAEAEARGWELTREADRDIAESPDRSEGVSAFFEKRAPNWS